MRIIKWCKQIILTKRIIVILCFILSFLHVFAIDKESVEKILFKKFQRVNHFLVYGFTNGYDDGVKIAQYKANKKQYEIDRGIKKATYTKGEIEINKGYYYGKERGYNDEMNRILEQRQTQQMILQQQIIQQQILQDQAMQDIPTVQSDLGF